MVNLWMTNGICMQTSSSEAYRLLLTLIFSIDDNNTLILGYSLSTFCHTSACERMHFDTVTHIVG